MEREIVPVPLAPVVPCGRMRVGRGGGGGGGGEIAAHHSSAPQQHGHTTTSHRHCGAQTAARPHSHARPPLRRTTAARPNSHARPPQLRFATPARRHNHTTTTTAVRHSSTAKQPHATTRLRCSNTAATHQSSCRRVRRRCGSL